MWNRIWVASAAATATAVMVAAVLWTDALETGHTDGGLKVETAEVAETCVGKQPAPAGDGSESREDAPFYRTLAYIDKTAEQRHSAVLTGLSVDVKHKALDVYRIPSAAFDADVCGAAEKDVTLRLYDTVANREDLDALAGRISADMHRWDGTFALREVGVDERGWVNVGVDEPDVAEPFITGEFGDVHIRVVYVDQASDD